MIKKYQQPDFLQNTISQDEYEKWLSRKARTHVRRDRKRGSRTAKVEEYKMAIHKAIIDGKGLDAYTGEQLDWKLIRKYSNEESKSGGREYKKKFALLPSVDHVGDGTGMADFKICSWKTNDAKNDLSYAEFVQLCKMVVGMASK